MVLEAIEDYERGWKDGSSGLGGERVARGTYAIEHVMPRKWSANWPLPAGSNEGDRDRIIHTIGNLTLLTGRLNAKVSNGPWLGAGGKREGLEANDVLLLNRELVKRGKDAWTDEAIRSRTEELSKTITRIWPVPDGHRSGVSAEKVIPRHKVDLADLISAGSLLAGMPLLPRRKKLAGHVVTLLQGGQIDVDGKTFSTPSGAAAAITGKPTNGWWFFLVDHASRRSLRDVWRDYVDALAVDVEDDEADHDGEDED
jgi:hypothetical protein